MESSFRWLTPDLLESITDGFVFLDQETRYVYVNEAAVRLLWKPREELLGRKAWDVFPQPPDSPFREPLDRAMATGQPTRVEGLNVRRGIWYDCHFFPSEDGLTVIFQDVTEKKRTEVALLESEARFRLLADASPILIWMADVTGAGTYFNQGWLEFTGRRLDQEIGYGWAEGVHPDDRAGCLARYQGAIDEQARFEMEYRLRRHDGTYRWILDHGIPLFDAAEEFQGFIGGGVDIHERRQAEERLVFLNEASRVLSSSLDYETTLGHVAQLMVPRLADWFAIDRVTEAGTVERGAIAHKDPEKVRWAQEYRRQNPVDMESPRGVANVIRTGQPEFYPVITDEMLVAAARDEAQLALVRQIGFRSVMTVPLKSREKVIGALMMVWSETENHYTEADLLFAQELAGRIAIAIDNARLYEEARTAEARLKAANESLELRVQERTSELQQRNRELQDFAHVASHDLQEPLRKFRTFLGLLQEELPEASTTVSDYIERMESSAERMAQLVTALLALSRVATRGESFTTVDLGTVIREVLSDLEVTLAEAEGRVEIGDLCPVEGDALQMRQVFQNLIGNALKFHREGVPPVITIASEVVPAGPGSPYRFACRVTVADNGIGFEEKYLDRIFMPFQRLHGRSQFPGSGMGLAICRRIVERHHGSITARSTPGEGSVFVLELPLAAGHAPPA